MKLLAPYARVTIGDDTFTWGDGYLQSITLTLAEGQNSTRCSFKIYDPGKRFADKYLAYIDEIQGLEPLQVPNSGSPRSTGSSATAVGDASANVKAFLDMIAWAEGADYNILFGGSTFSSFADHPRRTICSGGFCSTAAGRYQFLDTTWNEVAAQEGLTDFTPQSQDIGAINRLETRSALSDIESGDWATALDKVSFEWASLPASDGTYRYAGQGTKTPQQVYDYLDTRVAFYAPGGQEQQAADNSVETAANPPQEPPKRKETLAGSQITVELGFNGQLLIASSLLHTSLEYSLYDYDTLVFGGQAASWVLTQRRRNTAYTNVTFRQVAQKITQAYGLQLDMPESGPKYDYFPQRGMTDYEALLVEARRIGYRVKCRGNTLSIKPRDVEINSDVFTLEYARNLGLSFDIKHQAQTSSSGGARSSTPGETTTTGQRKVEVDQDTGEQKVIQPENLVGAGELPEQFTTGSATAETKPRTNGATDEVDAVRRNNESRIKGIVATWQGPTTPEMLQLLDPDRPFRTLGFSPVIDRFWVVDTITHTLDVSGGFKTSGTCYSPLKNKYPAPEGSSTGSAPGSPPPLNPGGFIRPTSGSITSRFRTAKRPNHQGIDIADKGGTPVYASADGVVSAVATGCPPFKAQDSCGGGYGNFVYLEHADGFQTRYAHLSVVNVSNGQQVKQGQKIGEQGNSGASRGVHLHFEIRKNGAPQNPENYIS